MELKITDEDAGMFRLWIERDIDIPYFEASKLLDDRATMLADLKAMTAERDALYQDSQEHRKAMWDINNAVIEVCCDFGVDIGTADGGTEAVVSNLEVGLKRIAPLRAGSVAPVVTERMIRDGIDAFYKSGGRVPSEQEIESALTAAFAHLGGERASAKYDGGFSNLLRQQNEYIKAEEAEEAGLAAAKVTEVHARATADKPAGRESDVAAPYDFVGSLQGVASFCETAVRSGGMEPDDIKIVIRKLRDAACVIDQIQKIRDGKLGLMLSCQSISNEMDLVKEICSAVCRVEGLDPDELQEEYETEAHAYRQTDPQWTRYADAVCGVLEKLPSRQSIRNEAFREAANAIAPKGPRPCDCVTCDCQNYDDAASVAAWDSDRASAEIIRSLIVPEPKP